MHIIYVLNIYLLTPPRHIGPHRCAGCLWRSRSSLKREMAKRLVGRGVVEIAELSASMFCLFVLEQPVVVLNLVNLHSEFPFILYLPLTLTIRSLTLILNLSITLSR